MDHKIAIFSIRLYKLKVGYVPKWFTNLLGTGVDGTAGTGDRASCTLSGGM